MPHDDSLTALNAQVVECRLCPRLVAWREEVAHTRRRAFADQEYWGKPVLGLGAAQARLMIVGLAPGAHGSNRTGRMFTGDGSGDFLFPALYRAGFANQPISTARGDGLEMVDAYISATCRCAPPANKPLPIEIENCRPYLDAEIALLPNLRGFVALGRIAFDWLLGWYRRQGAMGAQGAQAAGLEFQHAALHHPAPGMPWLLASYHPSRQNTQTGRLTAAMFDNVWNKARNLLSD